MYFGIKICLVEIILLSRGSAERCAYNYSHRSIPENVISFYENNGGFLEAGCPLLKSKSSLAPKYYEYLFKSEVTSGACISSTYHKGDVPIGGGPTFYDEMVQKEAVKRGGVIFNLDGNVEAFVLPYATIYTTINNKKIRNINDRENTISIDISLAMMWMDYSIFTYEPSYFGSAFTQNSGGEITPENSKMIWRPDLPVHNLHKFKEFIDSFRQISLNVLKINHLDDGLCMIGPMLKYEIEAKITFYCAFDFHNYPMDKSRCKLRFGGQRSNLKFVLYDPNKESLRHETFRSSDLEVLVSLAEDRNATPTRNSIGLDMNIRRELRPYVLKYYLPCIIITLVSQCSFVISLDALPGRVALVVTQLLTLTSLFIHQMVNII